jgi:calcineurin-like phosphoesterase family protein
MNRGPFFISDTHFNHGNIIKYSFRPFLDDVGKEILLRLNQGDPKAKVQWKEHRLPQENILAHDEALIENWNGLVYPGHKVYCIGDFAFAKPDKIREILGRLNGLIHLIRGNHDKNISQVKDCFVWIKDYYELNIEDDDANRGTQLIVLSHYAFRVWNKSHYGSFSIFGHSHSSLEDPNYDNRLTMDVGVDATAIRMEQEHGKESDATAIKMAQRQGKEINASYYRPISYAEIKEIMAERTFESVDHHE